MKTATIKHVSCVLPFGLVSLEEASVACALTEARLGEFVESGAAPHWRIDDGPPLFKVSELKQWVKDSLLSSHGGLLPPPRIVLIAEEPAVVATLPSRLAELNLTCRLYPFPCRFSIGIYFLCLDGDVVYVGQSMKLNARVGSHTDKEFDRAFVFPCVPEHLDHLEGAFIKAWKPKYNGNGGPVIDRLLLKDNYPSLFQAVEAGL